jgi:hypothetical protein
LGERAAGRQARIASGFCQILIETLKHWPHRTGSVRTERCLSAKNQDLSSTEEASVIINIVQSGSDVVAAGSGSIDTSASQLNFVKNKERGSGMN